jgi:osmotically-inducible protein OsmY
MTETRFRTDAQVKAAVVSELEWTPSVDSTHIGVAVEGGAVALSGEVDTYAEKVLAETAALSIVGVTVVADELTVRTPWGPPTDEAIAAEVARALDRAVDVPEGIQAVVVDHHVTLSGTVTWRYQREAAERVVRYLKGVQGLSNLVSVRPALTPGDLSAAITAAFVRSAQIESQHIHVTAVGGSVTLDGTVASWSESRRADTVAWSAPGVTGVLNRLVIRE